MRFWKLAFLNSRSEAHVGLYSRANGDLGRETKPNLLLASQNWHLLKEFHFVPFRLALGAGTPIQADDQSGSSDQVGENAMNPKKAFREGTSCRENVRFRKNFFVRFERRFMLQLFAKAR